MASQTKAEVVDSIAPPSSGGDQPATDAAPFSPRLLSVGFIFGLMISSVLMISCVVYLFAFMISTNSAVSITLTEAQLAPLRVLRPPADTKNNATTVPTSVSPPIVQSTPIGSYTENERLATLSIYSRLLMAGLVFNSCGLMIGVAMAFLGLSLFLLGVKGQLDAKGRTEKFAVQLIRVSPGALAIICSAMIVFACLHYRPQMHLGRGGDDVAVELMGPPPAPHGR